MPREQAQLVPVVGIVAEREPVQSGADRDVRRCAAATGANPDDRRRLELAFSDSTQPLAARAPSSSSRSWVPWAKQMCGPSRSTRRSSSTIPSG